MKKKFSFLIVFLIITIIIGGVIQIKAYDKADSTVDRLSNFLKTRPGSNKLDYSSELTLNDVLELRDQVSVAITNAENGMYDVDLTLAKQQFNNINGALDTLNADTTNQSLFYDFFEQLYDVYAYTVESHKVEGRGFWHRPFETSLEEVDNTLQELQNMNVNMLYVETFWNGYLIYDSQVPDALQHPFTRYADYGDYGNNLLKAFVEEGKKYGIEVHAWVEDFFVGFGSSIFDSPILKKHPEWTLYNYDRSVSQKLEGGPYLFMDPAIPEVRQFLKNIYVEMATTTDIASIHLDYIRYPVTSSDIKLYDNGFSNYSEREFKYLYGYEGDLRTLLDSSKNPNFYKVYADWKEYKTNVISDFVAGVYYEVKHANKNVYLSTAIFGNPDDAIVKKMQDWNSWAQDGYIELILPMAYYKSSNSVAYEVNRLTNLVGDNAFSYTGIAPSFMGYNDHYNTMQIMASLASGAQGSTIFASQMYLISKNEYNAKAQRILGDGVWRNSAVVPHEDPGLVIPTQLDYILDKASRIYVPGGAMTAEQLTDLQSEFTRIEALPMSTSVDLTSVATELSNLDLNQYADDPAKSRMNEDIEYLINVIHLKRTRIDLDNTIDISTNPDQNTTLPPEEKTCDEDPSQEKCQITTTTEETITTTSEQTTTTTIEQTTTTQDSVPDTADDTTDDGDKTILIVISSLVGAALALSILRLIKRRA